MKVQIFVLCVLGIMGFVQSQYADYQDDNQEDKPVSVKIRLEVITDFKAKQSKEIFSLEMNEKETVVINQRYLDAKKENPDVNQNVAVPNDSSLELHKELTNKNVYKLKDLDIKCFKKHIHTFSTFEVVIDVKFKEGKTKKNNFTVKKCGANIEIKEKEYLFVIDKICETVTKQIKQSQARNLFCVTCLTKYTKSQQEHIIEHHVGCIKCSAKKLCLKFDGQPCKSDSTKICKKCAESEVVCAICSASMKPKWVNDGCHEDKKCCKDKPHPPLNLKESLKCENCKKETKNNCSKICDECAEKSGVCAHCLKSREKVKDEEGWIKPGKHDPGACCEKQMHIMLAKSIVCPGCGKKTHGIVCTVCCGDCAGKFNVCTHCGKKKE